VSLEKDEVKMVKDGRGKITGLRSKDSPPILNIYIPEMI